MINQALMKKILRIKVETSKNIVKLDFKTKLDVKKCCLKSVNNFKKLSANVTI